jgi:hypothetical protein
MRRELGARLRRLNERRDVPVAPAVAVISFWVAVTLGISLGLGLVGAGVVLVTSLVG